MTVGVEPAVAVHHTPRLSLSTFEALRYRDYRFLWVSQIGFGLAQQAEMLIRTWLVLELTNSAIAVGLVHLTRAAGAVSIMPVAGVLADRLDQRFLMTAANLLNAFFFTVLAILYGTGHIAIWQVVITSIFAGASMTVQNTSVQAAIPLIIPRERLMNATALQSVIIGAARIIGPATAGFMIQFVGVSGAYVVTALLLCIPLTMFMQMQPLRVEESVRDRDPFFASFKKGAAFAFSSPTVRVIMLVSLTLIMLGIPFLQLMPLYTRDVLKVSPATMGLLISIPGFLTIAGGLFAASLGDFKYKGRLLFVAVTAPPVTTLILSQTDSFWIALFATCWFGALVSLYQPAMLSSVMKATPQEMRGRVSGFISMSQNLGSVGVLIYGLAADPLGIQTTYLVLGALALLLQIGFFVSMKSYRQMS